MTGTVHVYAPQPVRKAAFATTCPDCKRRTRMLSIHTPWYGWDSTCIRCGRKWCDGEWMPLNFERGARDKSIAKAKARFRLQVDPNVVAAWESELADLTDSIAEHHDDGAGAWAG